VEGVLREHPGVRDCAVFGVPDDLAGERPVAAVVVAEDAFGAAGSQGDPGAEAVREALLSQVATRLARYKHLRDVLVVEQIPRNPSGKVLRWALRDQYVASHHS
jgi:acyl-CoA synthetase (AMP-forming)/AMP-acid ligase II